MSSQYDPKYMLCIPCGKYSKQPYGVGQCPHCSTAQTSTPPKIIPLEPEFVVKEDQHSGEFEVTRSDGLSGFICIHYSTSRVYARIRYHHPGMILDRYFVESETGPPIKELCQQAIEWMRETMKEIQYPLPPSVIEASKDYQTKLLNGEIK